MDPCGWPGVSQPCQPTILKPQSHPPSLDLARGSSASNRQSARPLRTRPYKRVTLIMVGFFTTEATIKIKHFRREELIAMEKHMFLATVADRQTAASRGEGKKDCKHSPAFGWVLIGWALGRSLSLLTFQDIFKARRSQPPPPFFRLFLEHFLCIFLGDSPRKIHRNFSQGELTLTNKQNLVNDLGERGGKSVFIQCGCWEELCSPYTGAKPQPNTG